MMKRIGGAPSTAQSDRARKTLHRLIALLLAGTCLSPCPGWAVDVASEAELRNAIFASNGGGDTTINLTGNITLTQSLSMITSNVTVMSKSGDA